MSMSDLIEETIASIPIGSLRKLTTVCGWSHQREREQEDAPWEHTYNVSCVVLALTRTSDVPITFSSKAIFFVQKKFRGFNETELERAVQDWAGNVSYLLTGAQGIQLSLPSTQKVEARMVQACKAYMALEEENFTARGCRYGETKRNNYHQRWKNTLENALGMTTCFCSLCGQWYTKNTDHRC
jgi:hypothetical protein